MPGRIRRLVAPGALFAGLFFFGLSMLFLAAESHEEGRVDLAPSFFGVVNGTAIIAFPVDYHGERTERIEVAYGFPNGSGDAFLVGCADLARVRLGEPPREPLLAYMGLRNASFVANQQTVTDTSPLYPFDAQRGYALRCAPALVFRWPADGSDPSVGRPHVEASHLSADLDGENFVIYTILVGGGALLALFGGLAWARAVPRGGAIADAGSTVEILRASLDQMGAQLERTRKHLLLGGVLGIFLWYPFLVPWAWRTAARASESRFVPWAVAALTMLFLVVLTLLWAREFHRLDRELIRWRRRMSDLRAREARLLDTLDAEGR